MKDEEEVKERLFAIKNAEDSSGQALFHLLQITLQENGLKLEKIVGESFDGASNIRGQYIWVQKFIKDVAPNATLSE